MRKFLIAVFLVLANFISFGQSKFLFQDNFSNTPVFSLDPKLGYTPWDETCCAWSFTNSDSFFVSSSKSGRFELRKSDPSPQPNDSKRSEMEWNGGGLPMGATWYSINIMPAPYSAVDPAPEGLFQLHDKMPNNGSSNWTNPFGIWNQNGRWLVQISYDVYHLPEDGGKHIVTQRFDIGPVVPGKFVNWTLHTNYSWADTGFVEVYKDGVKVVDYKGPCAYNGAMPDPYFKFGIYKWPWANPGFQPPSTTTLRVFYFDDLKIGSRSNVLSDFYTPPAPPVNKPPVANAGPDQTLAPGVTSTTLPGSGTDSDGTIVSYSWKMFLPAGSGLISSQQNWTIYGFGPGKYGAELTVTDNKSAKGVDTVYITVPVVNTAPVIANIPNTTVTIPVAFFTLTATATDAEGDPINYVWTRPNGTFSVGPSITDTIKVAGQYVYTITVTDSKGLSSSKTAVVNVNPIPPKLVIRVEAFINPLTGGFITILHYADGTQSDPIQ